MGARQSSPPSPETPSPASQSSSASPFSLPPSPESPSKLCQFSKEQADEFDKVIKVLKESEFQMVRESKAPDIPSNVLAKLFQLPSFPFDTKQSYLDDPDINQHPLLIKRILCSMLIDILKEYRDILKKIHALCRQCRSGEAVDGVKDKINDIITKDLIKAQTLFNSFNQTFFNSEVYSRDEYMQSLKFKFDKLGETNEMFADAEGIENEMKAICTKRQEWQAAKIDAAGLGGKSSSSRSKKRKQMKMKMKSSNYRSKTRNSKKKYNRKSVKSKRMN